MKRLSLGKGCVDCCFDVGDKTICHILCGAYPAPRSKAAAQYHDTDWKKLATRDDCNADES